MPRGDSVYEISENDEIEELIAKIKRKYSIKDKESQGTSSRMVSQNINDDEQNVNQYSFEHPHHNFFNDFTAIDGNILECLLEKSKKSS